MYKKLCVSESWGHKYFYLEGSHPERDRLFFFPGQGVKVRWPDGSILTETIREKEEVVHIQDHANVDVVRNKIPFIDILHRGKSVAVELAGLEIWVPGRKFGP